LAAAGAAGAGIVSSSGAPVSIATNASPTTLFTLGGNTVSAKNKMSGSWSGTTYGHASARIDVGGFRVTSVSAGATIDSGFAAVSGAIYNSVTFKSAATSSSWTGLPLGESLLVGFGPGGNGGNYYGWINYTLSIDEGEYTFFINSWAYNDVEGEGIIAGENRAAGSSAVPGLGGLAALAIGAAGVRSRRQRTIA